MWIVADKALAVPIGAMKDGVFLGLMTLRTEIAPSGEQGDRCFVFFRDDLVAVRATHPNCRVDEPAFFLLGVAGQACFRPDVLWFNEGMLDSFFSKNTKRR
jgi:hypothetical protein